MKIHLILLVATALVSGCEERKVLDLDNHPDPELRRIANQIADQSLATINVATGEFSTNPVGKYQMSVAEGGYITRMDTQTGKLWLLVPATHANNPTGKSYWKQVVED